MSDEDDDDEPFNGVYENGSWYWDDLNMQLCFVLNGEPLQKESEKETLIKVITGQAQFKDDIDFIEQARYKRRYQRKAQPGHPNVVTLQDVKDLVLYTAPINMLTVSMINMLHSNTTERLIRATIFYCQYYVQVKDFIEERASETPEKIRTAETTILENSLMDDLCDIRALVACEYCNFILGSADMRNFHHKGPNKRNKSLSCKDSKLFEFLLCFIVQIIWICLGRSSLNIIKVEVNRLFKSEQFNSVEHTLKTGYLKSMTYEERKIMTGNCLRNYKKLVTRSPLLNEVLCEKKTDYRNMCLGTVKHVGLSHRQMYLKKVISLPEEKLIDQDICVGILGLPRIKFDTMLKPLPISKKDASFHSKTTTLSSFGRKSKSKASQHSSSKSLKKIVQLYPDVILPPSSPPDIGIYNTTPDFSSDIGHVTEKQHVNPKLKWFERRKRLLKTENEKKEVQRII